MEAGQGKSAGRRVAIAIGMVGTLALVSAMVSSPARACGGVFCSNGQLVQAAERILFVEHEDGTVTAIVQIQYQGPADEFAWVLPVPGTPEVDVSSNIVFNRLRLWSDPFPSVSESGPCALGGIPALGGSPPYAGVTVLSTGQVGPYVYDIIQLDPSLPRPGDVAAEWLATNGYEVAQLGVDRLGQYLLQGMNLLALKLNKQADTGSLRPIELRYPASCPMIPLRPTAVAAVQDMPIQVWIVGPSRAVATNYLMAELNEARFTFGAGTGPNWYTDLVTEAVDEAGGQAFVTEHVAPSSDFEGRIFSSRSDDVVGRLDWESTTDRGLFRSLTLRYGSWDGYSDAIAPHFSSPEDVAALLAICSSRCVEADVPRPRRMTQRARAELREAIVADVTTPVIRAQELIVSRPTISRLLTTMSANEMDVDPRFDFNPDLPMVPRVHWIEANWSCDELTLEFQDDTSVILPDDLSLLNMFTTPSELGPALSFSWQAQTAGEGTVLVDNRRDFDFRPPAPPMSMTDGGTAPLPPPMVDGGGGCSTTPMRAADGAGWSLVLFAMLGLFRRSRRFTSRSG